MHQNFRYLRADRLARIEQEELETQIDRAVQGFCSLDGCAEELANRLVGEGYLSYDDLSVIEPPDLMEMGELTAEQVDHIVNQAEARAEEAERATEEENRQRRAAQKAAETLAAAEAAAAKVKAEAEAAASESSTESEAAAESAGTGDADVPSEPAPQGDSP